MDKTLEWCEHRQLQTHTDWLENLGHKDDPWVLADRVTQVFYVLDSEIGKQKKIGIDNVEDNDDNINQFE
jgi:hypothetical protein